jgi:hypothetical protein
MSVRMRAKFQVTKVVRSETSESLSFSAVGADKYGPNGENEDSDFARWTPSGQLHMSVTNPDLLGKFNEGEKYYLDFSKAE